MSKALIITEKPSVAKDIAEALGGFEKKDNGEYYESSEYVCTYAVGHILGLVAPEDIDPKYKRWKLDDLPILPDEFRLKPIEAQKKRIKVIEKLMRRKDISTLINACDAAREGELIFREIVNYVKPRSDLELKRLWLQSMTKDSIKKGFASLINDEKMLGLAAAAECRSYSDWLIGMNATRALTVRLKTRATSGAWSAGRVQTPTLCLLVNRELEILKHRPVDYFRIKAKFLQNGHEYEGTWYDPKFKKSDENDEAKEDRIFDELKHKKILEKIDQKAGTATEKRKEKTRKAPILFDLTSLQREANRRFGWAAVRTLRAAQRCYEAHKVLTYPRTSSKCLPNDYREPVQELLKTFAKPSSFVSESAQYLLKNGLKNESKIFNDAGVTDHFAIIPTGEVKKLEGDDARLFDLVTRTFIAAFFPDAIFEEVERTTVVENEAFRSKPPLVLKYAGWLSVFNRDKKEEVEFPPLKSPGENHVQHLSSETENLKTKPPPRIGEAALLSLMENAGRQVEDEELAQALQKAEGLGTAATRADIIENLKAKDYVDENLRPTVKGIRLIDILQRIKAEAITSAELTARLEKHLDEVEDQKRKKDAFLDEVKAVATKVVEAAKNFTFEDIYPSDKSLGSCPVCQSPVYEKAWFYGCAESTKPMDERKNCDFLLWKDYFGRYMDASTVEYILNSKEPVEVDGFVGLNGQTYKAFLHIEKGKLVKQASESEGPEVDASIDPTPVCPCPRHENCQIREFTSEYRCEKDDKTNYRLPKVLCKRTLLRGEIKDLLEKKETDFLTGFISKKGRPFRAQLKLEKDFSFTFAFPERKKKGEEAEA